MRPPLLPSSGREPTHAYRCMRGMRRLALLAVGFVALVVVAAVTLAAGGRHWRALPLRSPARATPRLTAVLSDSRGSRIAQIDPATFAPVRVSARLRYYDGWVRSPNGRLLAISTNPGTNDVSVSTLHFTTAATLRWQRRGVRLGGYFHAAFWPRPRIMYVLVGDCCGPGLTLDRVDPVARRIVSRTKVPEPLLAIARSAAGLVLLEGGKYNALGAARLVVVGADGRVRSVRLGRILAGRHFDQSGQDPIGTMRQPGLAVDSSHEVAYVLDPDGLVAAVRLRDLRVSYHRAGGRSVLARLSSWLTPVAQAKGANGPMLTAQWLGRGLIALTGNNESAVEHEDGGMDFSVRPAGLRIVDTRNWSVHMLDPRADSVLVADGVLLASGGSSRSDSTGATSSGEGVAAYDRDGSLRWRLDRGVRVSLIAAYGNRGLVQKVDPDSTETAPLQLVDLDTGRVVRTLPGDTYDWLLLGSGS